MPSAAAVDAPALAVVWDMRKPFPGFSHLTRGAVDRAELMALERVQFLDKFPYFYANLESRQYHEFLAFKSIEQIEYWRATAAALC
ncbi:hypothetical protein HIM_06820 [Hirsutella minnesotensis 3608]|uniref:Uncharacterized protein n=1 Tax=Hirsutella minnesotensis 3608 TaxID=1043627 RepID=A0A0F7ZZ69_9HYPO|nr:hypothetical protein HIM_06820 [Hirsutella minnesotensis 3608]